MEFMTMQLSNLNQLVEESLKKIDVLPTTPSLPSCMKLPLASMDEVDRAETAIQYKETFDATVSIPGLFTLLLMFMFKLHAG